MTVYVFDQISPDNPPILDSVDDNDSVVFHGGPARLASVSFGQAANGIFTTTISFGGHTVGFEPGISIVSAHDDLIFDDGSKLLIGGTRNEAFEGGAKDDAMFGNGGDDTLDGHGGANVLQGNQGNDSLLADIGADTILGGQGDDRIQAGVLGPGLDSFPTEPSLVQEAGNVVNGNKGDDTIVGGNGQDTLLGGQGDDVISDGGGPGDFVFGNLGNDHLISHGSGQLFGEDGSDTIVALAAGAQLSGGAGVDLFDFALPSSAVITGVSGAIVDWSGEDLLAFSNVAARHAYEELVAPDFASALAMANNAIANSTDPMRSGGEVVMVQVGGDVIAFAANLGSPDADFAIRLVGRTLADVGAPNIL